MIEKPYLIDNEPASANDIFELAKVYGYDPDIKFTSQAAHVLRQNNHTVENNPDWKEKQNSKSI